MMACWTSYSNLVRDPASSTMIVWIWLYMAVCLSVLQVHSADPCEEHKTCQACVRATPACKWCSSINFKRSQRCASASTAFSECPDENIENPKGSVSASGYDQDFSNVTQIKPQRFKIKLRPGETQAFNFSFKPSRNFPADLYFLLDSSTTMANTLRTTASAAKGIYDSMKKNTDDVLIGMGTFIDKNAAPFVREKNLSHPISSYTHKLSLTNDTVLFEKLVNDLASNTKGNYDNREGGFDALAQAITCNIGWRAMSRKIIFFFTDGLSHTAGDGKFAGITYPYDGECYTDKNGKYTKELEMDYPSIGMISELAQREGVTIIFLVEKPVKNMYNNIAKHIHGSQMVQYQAFEENIYFEGSTSLDKLLSKIYRNITKTIKFDTIMTPKEQKHVKLTFEPNCTGGKNDPKCAVSIKKQEPIDFQGNITLSNYYEEDHIHLHISIGSGIKEKLVLDIDVVDCDCEDEEKESSYCNGYGTKRCGACECNENRIGNKCQCMQNKDHDTNDESSCKPEGDKDHLPCNGEGYCECGTCKCNQGREGKYCECIKDNCMDKCNGHGRCYCGVCTCDKGWSGENCACSEKPCISIHGKMCNGRGRCHCGSCKCEERAAWDARVNQNRDTCEMNSCENCHIDQCLRLEECAKCSINEETDCSQPCGAVNVDFIDHLNGTSNDSICENVKVGIGCYTRLRYKYDDVNYQIHLLVQREKSCLESYYRFGGSILVALVVIGLATLVAWKVLTDRRDKREYQQFLKLHGADRDESCQNPIYEPASTTIRNPAFRKPSVDFTLQ